MDAVKRSLIGNEHRSCEYGGYLNLQTEAAARRTMDQTSAGKRVREVVSSPASHGRAG